MTRGTTRMRRTRSNFLAGLVPAALASVLLLVPATAGAAPCPNESARVGASAHLPDCRAFEMVSPLVKNGSVPTAMGVVPAGDKVIFSSSGAFADAGSANAVASPYLARRGEGEGWSTKSLAPPATVFSTYFQVAVLAPLDFSPDLESTLWKMRTSEQDATGLSEFYVRNADGDFAPLTGPMPGPTSTLRPVGASDDLSHVIVTMDSRQLTVTDGTTNARTITDMVEVVGGETPEIRQIGVDNSGTTIQPTCGLATSTPGSFAGSPLNAMSRDGSRIVFQPLCNDSRNRQYVRVNGTQTFEVSASQCARASAPSCNAPARVSAQGASRDGQVFLFATTQQLIDADIDSGTDLYICDLDSLPAPVTPTNGCPSPLVGVTVTGTATSADVRAVLTLSDDGDRVYFIAGGVLAGANEEGDVPGSGANNLYVYDRTGTPHIDYIGAIAANDLLLSTFGCSVQGQCVVSTSSGSARYMVFPTLSALTSDDEDNKDDIYRYDAVSKSLDRMWPSDPAHNGPNREFHASIAARGTNSSGALAGLYSAGRDNGRAITDDGSRVFFETPEALSPNDRTTGESTSDCTELSRQVDEMPRTGCDVYQWSSDGSITLVSDGLSESGSAVELITPSGDDVFITTTTQVSPRDTDTSIDIYNARVNGGDPPVPSVGQPCDPLADECQVTSPAPLLPTIAPPSGGSPDAAPSFALTRPNGATLRQLARTGRAKIRVRVSQAGRLTVKATARLRGRTRVVSRAVKTARRPGQYVIDLKLSKAARARLRRSGRLSMRLVVDFSRGAARRKLTLELNRVRSADKPGTTNRRRSS